MLWRPIFAVNSSFIWFELLFDCVSTNAATWVGCIGSDLTDGPFALCTPNPCFRLSSRRDLFGLEHVVLRQTRRTTKPVSHCVVRLFAPTPHPRGERKEGWPLWKALWCSAQQVPFQQDKETVVPITMSSSGTTSSSGMTI